MVTDQTINKEVHESTEALIQDFIRPREKKAPEAITQVIAKPAAPVVKPATPAPDDFEEEEIEQIVEEEEPEVKPQPKKKASPVVSDESDFTSDIYIGLFDSAQTGVFTWQMKKRLKKKLEGSFEQAKIICKKIDKGVIKESDLDEKQVRDLILLQSFMVDSEEVPLNDDEYKRLQKLLARVIEENGGKIPPGIGIALTGISIISKRLSLLAD